MLDDTLAKALGLTRRLVSSKKTPDAILTRKVGA
jgi:hypothetical protein